jgi:hypothetical protein
MNGLAFALLIFLVIGFFYIIFKHSRSNAACSSRGEQREVSKNNNDTDTSSVASGDSDTSGGSNKCYDLYGEIRSFMGKQAAYLGA